ncbi:MAG: hypothetical protein SFX74_05570, partial [Fimbriimonadaceae bacterium]|nr:hypothetical protein [Fimbriimonadaceae bacterium]
FIVIDQSNFIRWVNIPLRKVDKFYGPEVARYCRERLPKILAAKPLIAGKDDSLTSMPKRPPLGPNGR